MLKSVPLGRVGQFVVVAVGMFTLGRFTAEKHAIAPVASSPSTPINVARSLPLSSLESNPVLATTTEQQVRAWTKRLEETPPSESRDEDRLRMLAAWALAKPLAALEYARKITPRDQQAQALSTVFTSWAKEDPSGAWKWVTTNEPGEHAHLRAVLAETARTKPELAAEFAASFSREHPEASAEVYFAALDGVFHMGNYDAAKLMVARAEMPNDEQKNSLINLLAGQWGRYQPDKAAAWVLDLPPGPVREQALDAVGQAWSDLDPVQAANFAVKLPAGAARQTALRQAISKWTLDDPAQASNWVLQFDAHQDFDQAVAAIATSYNVMNRNVNLALGWAATIQDEKLRRESTVAVVSNWYANDAPAALRFIKSSSDVSDTTRAELLKLVVPPSAPTATPSMP